VPDDTAFMQQKINNCIHSATQRGRLCRFVSRQGRYDYFISSKITIPPVRIFQLESDSRVRFHITTALPVVIEHQNPHECTTEGLTFVPDVVGIGSIIRAYQAVSTPGSPEPTHSVWSGIRCDGTAGNFDRLLLFDGPDNNNEWHKAVDCRAQNYKEELIRILGAQRKAIAIENCVGHAQGFGKHLVYTESDIHWRAGGGGGHNVADFYLDAKSINPITFEGGSFENSAALIYEPGPGAAQRPLTMKGVRWSQRAGIGALANSRYFIEVANPGGYTFENNQFGEGDAGERDLPRVRMSSASGFPFCLRFIGNAWGTYNAASEDPLAQPKAYNVTQGNNSRIKQEDTFRAIGGIASDLMRYADIHP
jgi:hypothetical protein